jgi:hypothetical protein
MKPSGIGRRSSGRSLRRSSGGQLGRLAADLLGLRAERILGVDRGLELLGRRRGLPVLASHLHEPRLPQPPGERVTQMVHECSRSLTGQFQTSSSVGMRGAGGWT